MTKVSKIPLNNYRLAANSSAAWYKIMAEMLRSYLRGEPVFVEFTGESDDRRTGSIGRLKITNIQDLLHGEYEYYYSRRGGKRELIEEHEDNVKDTAFANVRMDATVHWDKRSNRVQVQSGWGLVWLKGYDETKGTHWVWEKPETAKVVAKDKLGREIQKGDFISYILYHFDNSYNAAGIYYGKVTKVDNDGTVHAKNIQLKSDDKVDEKRIKDNSLIVIMTKDLMDQLMLARLSSI